MLLRMYSVSQVPGAEGDGRADGNHGFSNHDFSDSGH